MGFPPAVLGVPAYFAFSLSVVWVKCSKRFVRSAVFLHVWTWAGDDGVALWPRAFTVFFLTICSVPENVCCLFRQLDVVARMLTEKVPAANFMIALLLAWRFFQREAFVYVSIATKLLIGCPCALLKRTDHVGSFVDTYGHTGFEANLTNKSTHIGSVGRNSKFLRTDQSLHRALHKTSEKTSAHSYRMMSEQSTGKLPKEQVKNMSKPLVIKLMVQLRKPPRCPERRCGKRGTSHHVVLLDEINWLSQVTQWENHRTSLLSEASPSFLVKCSKRFVRRDACHVWNYCSDQNDYSLNSEGSKIRNSKSCFF